MLVDEVREDITRALASGSPVVLTAPTGSGKSTRVPLFLEEATGGAVLVIEPRRVACRSLATWVAEQRGEAVGGSIGYRVRFDDASGPSTRVLYATPGVALRMLRQGGTLPFRAVMVDELHERSWQVDLVVALLMRRRQHERDLGVLMASATLEAVPLAEKLGATIVEARGRQFPVEVEHEDAPSSPTTRDVELRVAAAVQRAREREDSGDVLVFLPGKGEIERCRRALLDAGIPAEHLVAVHGGVPPKVLAAAFRQGHARRVYLATNVAETSVTLPGVRTVIDVGLVRQLVHRAGRSVLALVPASRASLEQRAGRAGRVAPGRCVRLFSSRHSPEVSTPPEVTRVELDDLLLEAAACGLPARDLDAAPFPTPLPAFAVDRAWRRLRESGALDEDGRLTALGERLSSIPLAAAEAGVLLDPPPGLASTVADVSSLLDLEQDLLLPAGALGSAREDVELAREDLLGGSPHEVDALLRCLRRGDARRHGLHAAALDGARQRAKAFRALLDVRPRSPTDDEGAFPPWDDVAAHLLSRLPEAGFVLRPRALRPSRAGTAGKGGFAVERDPWANGSVEVEVRRWAPPGDPKAERERPTAGVLLQHTWLEGGARRAAVGRGWMMLPCAPRVLAAAGLGEERTAEPSLRGDGRRAPRLVARVERVLADVVLEEREKVLSGPPLLNAAARLLAEGRWLKREGARDLLEDDLHLWGLLWRWPADDVDVTRLSAGSEPPADVAAWTLERLTALGAHEAEDLALVDVADLRPALTSLFGVDDDTLARLAADFPRIWEYQGARYQVVVDPGQRRVTLEPEDKKAKKAREPTAAVLPRFRGFSVRHRQASRVVTLR